MQQRDVEALRSQDPVETGLVQRSLDLFSCRHPRLVLRLGRQLDSGDEEVRSSVRSIVRAQRTSEHRDRLVHVVLT